MPQGGGINRRRIQSKRVFRIKKNVKRHRPCKENPCTVCALFWHPGKFAFEIMFSKQIGTPFAPVPMSAVIDTETEREFQMFSAAQKLHDYFVFSFFQV